MNAVTPIVKHIDDIDWKFDEVLPDLSQFRYKRLNALADEISMYWFQKGRLADPDGIRTMSLAMEKDLDNWIGGDLVRESIVALRKEMATIPVASHIIAKAKEIAHNRKPKDGGRHAQHSPIDQWMEVSARRIMSSVLLGFFGIEETSFDGEILAHLAKAPTHMERDGFLRLIAVSPKLDQKTLAQFWGDRNPYNLTSQQIIHYLESKDELQG